MEAKVSILEDEKRLLGERYITSEARIEEQKTRIRGLAAQVDSLQCAAEELARCVVVVAFICVQLARFKLYKSARN